MTRWIGVVLTLVVAGAVFASCGDDDSGPTGTPSDTEPAPTTTYVLPSQIAELCPVIDDEFPQAMVALIETEKLEYEQGEPIDVTIRFFNCAGFAITRYYATAQRYDVTVNGPDGEVWRWSSGQTFAQAESEETYESGDDVTYSVTWDQADEGGTQAPPGEYEVAAEITSCDEPRITCGPTALRIITIVE